MTLGLVSWLDRIDWRAGDDGRPYLCALVG